MVLKSTLFVVAAALYMATLAWLASTGAEAALVEVWDVALAALSLALWGA